MQVFNPKKSIITVDRGVAVRATLLPAGTMRNVTTEKRIDPACSTPARLVKRPKMQSWIPTLFPSVKYTDAISFPRGIINILQK